VTVARTARRDAPTRCSGRVARFLIVSITTIVAVLIDAMDTDEGGREMGRGSA